MLPQLAIALGYLDIVNTDVTGFRSRLKDPDSIEIFTNIPNIVKNRSVELSGGHMTKAKLIEQWIKSNNKPDPDSYYYKYNEGVYNVMSRQFKNIYFNLLTEQEIKSDLNAHGIKFDPEEKLKSSNYIIDERPPAKNGILVLSVLDVCVKNGRKIKSTDFMARGVFTESGCSGGSVHHIAKIHRLFYEPLCGGVYCKTKSDVKEAFSVQRVFPEIKPKPKIGKPAPKALRSR